MTFDLTGTDAQRPSSINATKGGALSACAYALRCMIDPDIPINDGFYQVMDARHDARERPRFASVRPRSAAARTLWAGCARRRCEHSPRSCQSGRRRTRRARCSTSSFGGVNPRNGEYFVYYETQAGGYGGRRALDGMDGIQPHLQNTENAPIEETEANYPIRFLRYSLLPDSEGPGESRGGLGLRRDYEFEGDVTFSVMSERVRFAPQGLFGGEEARSNHYIRDPEGAGDPLPLEVQRGARGRRGDEHPERPAAAVTARSRLRDPALVRADVDSGRISPARAVNTYGVSIEASADSAGREQEPGT